MKSFFIGQYQIKPSVLQDGTGIAVSLGGLTSAEVKNARREAICIFQNPAEAPACPTNAKEGTDKRKTGLFLGTTALLADSLIKTSAQAEKRL